jgi:hypothetical protein
VRRVIARSWQICRGDNVAEELKGTLLYMGKSFSGVTVGFDGAAKSVPGPSAGAAGSKSIEHVESGRRSGGCIRVGGLYHAVSTRP